MEYSKQPSYATADVIWVQQPNNPISQRTSQFSCELYTFVIVCLLLVTFIFEYGIKTNTYFFLVFKKFDQHYFKLYLIKNIQLSAKLLFKTVELENLWLKLKQLGFIFIFI